MNIILSPLVFVLLIALAGAPGFILYTIIGIGWACYLKYQGSPWIWMEAAFWPSSVYLTFFDKSA